MKVQAIKIFITALILIGITPSINAQGVVTCIPPTCPPESCMTVYNIINNTDCDLEYVWTYPGNPCGGDIGAGITHSNQGPVAPSFPWTSPCMQFCDGPCECPTMFRLINPSGGGAVDPWGPSSSFPGTQSTVYYYDIAFCGTTPIDAKITFNSPGVGQFTIEFNDFP